MLASLVLAVVVTAGVRPADPWASAAVSWRGGQPRPTSISGVVPRTEALTVALRVRADAALPAGPLASLGTGPQPFVVEATSEGLAVTMRTSASKDPLGLLVRWAVLGRGEHEVVARYDRARFDLFVDGTWVDEDFPMGELALGAPDVAIQLAADERTRSFAVWPRALSDAEVAERSGGAAAVARARPGIVARLFGPASEPLQYFRPANFNVGDAFPYFADGTFHFLYLRDKRHHKTKNGLGAHQWAHATSKDLVRWQHQSTAIAVEDVAEASICTGSVFPHAGTHHAFYARRALDFSEHLALATSTDGVRFVKQPDFALPVPAGFGKDFRDPVVFRVPGDARFHMFVTASRPAQGGVLAHFTSPDLATWAEADHLETGGPPPECPDHFAWNGWYYLVYSRDLRARYRMARSPLGPWQTPDPEALGDVQLRVMKTAAFTGGRRIGVGWMSPKHWGGRAVFRELVQQKDGTLGTRFVPEMVPRQGPRLRVAFAQGQVLRGLPRNARVRLQIRPDPKTASPERPRLELVLRASAQGMGVPLVLDPASRTVRLGANVTAEKVSGLDGAYTLDLVLAGDVIDVAVDDRRTLILEGDTSQGTELAVLEGAGYTVTLLDARPLTPGPWLP